MTAFFISLTAVLIIFSAVGYAQECQVKDPPVAAQEGGFVRNADLFYGLVGWKPYGLAILELGQSTIDNNFIVATNRSRSTDSFTQTLFNIQNDRLYELSAWLQVSHGSAQVTPVMKTVSGLSYFIGDIGTVRNGCSTQLKSYFSFDVSEPVQLYFESQTVDVDIWADSISLLWSL